MRRVAQRAAAVLALAAVLSMVRVPANAGVVGMLAGGVQVNVPVESFRERKFSRIYKQRLDYSCGSAAIASLLSFHYDDRVDEADVFRGMYSHGDKAKITREGFSLLDMKEYLQRRGYAADGFRVPLRTLVSNRVPAILLLDEDGYLHFVIVKGVTERRVLLGDPAVGVQVVARGAFERMWNGVVFVIRDHRKIAAHHFNRPGAWDKLPRAPLGRAMDASSLATFTLPRPARADF